MGWSWRLEAGDGSVVDSLAAPTHPNQSDAESWLGEQWRELAAQGVARVTLLEDGSEVYGPMSLSES
jgi:hypothetical protein